MNLLEETRRVIDRTGHTVDEIIFIGSKDGDYECSWEEFTKLADEEYDDDFGTQYVAHDLIIAFSNKDVLKRDEYDGSERWVMHPSFKKPKKTKKIKAIFQWNYEHGLEELNS